jgi:hypothetical protein
MLSDGLIEPSVFVNLLVAVKRNFFAQIGYDFIQNAVAGKFLDQGVEDIVDGNVIFPITLRVVDFKLPVQPLDLSPTGDGHLFGGQPGAGAFEYRHNFEHLLNFSHGWFSNEYTSVGEKLDQAFRFEHSKRFAQRGAADADLFANFSLNDALTAHQSTFADHFAYLRSYFAMQGADIDALQYGAFSNLTEWPIGFGRMEICIHYTNISISIFFMESTIIIEVTSFKIVDYKICMLLLISA